MLKKTCPVYLIFLLSLSGCTSKEEKEAVKVYSTFADSLEDGKVRELFDFLINEEKRHLRRFEDDYDDYTDEMSHEKVRELIKKMYGK